MKKTISRILGVGLTLMLAVTLLLWSAPVAADTLEWDDEDPPEEFDTDNILDIAVAEGGVGIYVVDGTTTLYVSDDGGVSWEEATIVVDSTTMTGNVVAVSPDDPQYIAVAESGAGGEVYISDDSGATWDTLDVVDGSLTIYDIALSVEGSSRFVAVAGTGADGAEVWYYEIGAIGADWEEISTASYAGWAGGSTARAVAFSPNYISDEILTVVSANFDATGDPIEFHVFSFNTETWNDNVGGFSGYPVNINTEAEAITALNAASIAMSPDYLGSDDDLRIAFVGTSTNAGTQEAGIFLLEDDDVDALKDEVNIYSVDYDGTNLVAGADDDTTVYRSADPLEGSDADVDDTSAKKSPGGTGDTVVAFAGDDVVAGTSGDENAFAVSHDNGKTFNDISLINTAITNMLDVAVASDGSVIYLTVDGTGDDDLSLWRLDNDDWERVLSRPSEVDAQNFIVRVAPDDAGVVYLANAGGATGDTTIYYTEDGGEARWQTRTSRYPIVDLAAETDGGVAYVLTTSGYVSKSVNSGFTWGSKETTGQATSNMIMSLGEDLVLVGGVEYVSYSTDGNESWTDLEDELGNGNVQVTASGLDDGDYIYASTDAAGDDIYRWELGEDDSWDDFASLDSDLECFGIALSADGVLYVLSANATDSRMYRFLDPTDDDPDVSTADAAELLDRTPSALKMSAGSTNLWAVTTDTDEFFNYEDTVATAGPTLKGPKSGFVVPVNEISGDTADVNFSWVCPSDEVTLFDFKVAVDDGFDEVIFEFGSEEREDVGGGDEGDVMAFVMTDYDYDLMPGITYYWRVRVNEEGPVQSPWSETWSFTVGEAEARPPVTVEIPPAPEVKVEMPAPEVTVTVPPMVQVPPTPAPIAPWALILTIAIGALLVVALIILIIRTRRVT
jgi:hypothetical protein